ncbi:MAG: peptidoglycan-associated lipoprotein Pal [Burkholderiales bacterium]
MKRIWILLIAAIWLAGCATATKQSASIEDREVLDAAAMQKRQEQAAAQRQRDEAEVAKRAADEAERQRVELERIDREQKIARQMEEYRVRQQEEEQARRQAEESRLRAEEATRRETEAAQRLAQEQRLQEEQNRLAKELEDFRRELDAQRTRDQEKTDGQREKSRLTEDSAAVRNPGGEAIVGGAAGDTAIVGRPESEVWGQLKDASSLLGKRSVYFAYDQFVIDEQQLPIIEAHAKFLIANKALSIVIEGNCDDRGSREYNLSLGSKRAESVRRVMLALGVTGSQLRTVSFGSEKPVALGQDEESHAKNRRSDIVYPDEPQ